LDFCQQSTLEVRVVTVLYIQKDRECFFEGCSIFGRKAVIPTPEDLFNKRVEVPPVPRGNVSWAW
jgi:hypothetical protein